MCTPKETFEKKKMAAALAGWMCKMLEKHIKNLRREKSPTLGNNKLTSFLRIGHFCNTPNKRGFWSIFCLLVAFFRIMNTWPKIITTCCRNSFRRKYAQSISTAQCKWERHKLGYSVISKKNHLQTRGCMQQNLHKLNNNWFENIFLIDFWRYFRKSIEICIFWNYFPWI